MGRDLDQLDSVLRCFREIRLNRKEMLLREGEICRNVYFISAGALQAYVIDKDGEERTRDIFIEDEWCGELVSFMQQVPAVENIKAVEPTVLMAINRENFQLLMTRAPGFDMVYRQLLEAAYANSVYRINSFVSMPALDRIKWLMDNRPTLMSRFSSKLIASYLGINKDVFSRLKAKL